MKKQYNFKGILLILTALCCITASSSLFAQGGNGFYGPYFRHISTAGNSTSDYSRFTNDATNPSSARVLITPCYNPNSIYNNFNIGAYFSTVWSVYNESGSAIPSGSAYFVAVPSTNGTSFKHQSAGSNIVSNWTSVDNSASNNNPNALVFITRDWSGLNVNKARGVFYTANKWAIYNEDRSAFRVGDGYNVFVTSAGANAFIHRAVAGNISNNWTTLDHPLLNGNPNAQIIITHNWSAPQGNVYNDRPTGVWFNTTSNRWTIFNQDRVAMPVNTSFNVLVVSAAGGCSGSVTASNVRLNNGTNTATVAPGASVNLKLDYQLSNSSPGGSGAINQLVVGIGATSIGCAYNGIPTACPGSTSGNYNVDFTAPATPGTYLLYRKHDLQFSCQDARNNYAADPNKVQIATLTVAAPALTSVTFRVNVEEYLNGGATLAPNGIRIAGNFADLGGKNGNQNMENWAPLSASGAMTNVSGNIWQVTVTYPNASRGQAQLYKFVNGDWGVASEVFSDVSCAANDGSGIFNRSYTIPNSATNTTTTYCWESCGVCTGGVSINEKQKELPLEIYPNPADGILFMKFESKEYAGLELQIWDAQGKLALTLPTSFVQPGQQLISFDISGLKPGLYNLKATGLNQSFETKRLVVSH